MSTREERIAKYASVLREKCRIEPDLDLLRKVAIACGPSIFTDDGETVAATSEGELARVRQSFLVGRLGLADGPQLDEAIAAVIDRYGRSDRNKYRAVIYYLLVEHFGKANALA